MLKAISPIDGRYYSKTLRLNEYFSEYALIKYRLFVEIQYFIALVQRPLPELQDFDERHIDSLNDIFEHFSIQDAQAIKSIEETTNHDIKAIEYFLKQKLDALGLSDDREFIHFGLTSQDINNTAIPLIIKNALDDVYYPQIQELLSKLEELTQKWADTSMLAHTHGQPATPTTADRQIKVFIERINNQLDLLKRIPISAKFGGATGNLNAHHVAYPNIDWHQFADSFVSEYLGLERQHHTTQIAHYDNLAAIFQGLGRINTILLDFSKDMWQYISMNYLSQKTITGEIGSSAMPHKVNPIDFENAEGNLGVANALFHHLAEKLPISRLQRDLTDSTVLRNAGVPFAHTIIALKSLIKGISKIELNREKLWDDLENNWPIVSEAIQTILRRERYPEPYEALKKLTRGKSTITANDIYFFIGELNISEKVKEELRQITPHNFVGRNS